MSYRPRPHLSAALAHLRFSVVACAVVLGSAIGLQVCAFVAVHFVDVHKERVQGPASLEPLRVVGSRPTMGPDAVRAAVDPNPRADVNSVPGERGVLLGRATTVAQGAGVLAALLLMVLLLEGVFLAGAGAVPGVEKVVTAATLGFVLAALCLPLARWLPEVGFGGVFAPYAALVEESESVRSGAEGAKSPLVLLASRLLLPGAMIAGLAVVVVRFLSGVEAGILVTSVSELDEKLEREIRGMRPGQLAVPRAVGALNYALGSTPADSTIMEPQAPQPVRSAPPAFRVPGDPPAFPRNPGDSMKRPI